MPRVTHQLDPQFAALDLASLQDAALSTCRAFNATYACMRVQQIKTRVLHLRDQQVETSLDHRDLGVGVRVVVDGAWGFAATSSLTPEAVRRAARRACELAQRCAGLPGPRVQIAEEPVARGTHVSSYAVDPFDVPVAAMVDVLRDRAGLMQSLDHTSASLECAKETVFLADLAGAEIRQQRVRLYPVYTGVRITADGFDDMSTIAAPVGRGWEYCLDGYDWESELTALPGLLDEKCAAPSIKPGRYDLVIDPTNLWLTIHESVGHATEKDRALGYEANYAGTSFATPDQLDRLQYGSPHMNIRADRTAEHGLSTVGWDDEAVAAQSWDLIRDGVLVGYQLDRQMAAPERSNGCAYADSAEHVPIQRMPNVNLQPSPDGPDTAGLIGQVEDGIYIVGDKSWSIDMQRFNFQFTGQRFHRIRNGRLDGQVKDVAYQSTTLDFWNALAACGGQQTYVLGGAFNCGKGQPGQVAPVSHGCPSALFTQIPILNTRTEAGR